MGATFNHYITAVAPENSAADHLALVLLTIVIVIFVAAFLQLKSINNLFIVQVKLWILSWPRRLKLAKVGCLNFAPIMSC